MRRPFAIDAERTTARPAHELTALIRAPRTWPRWQPEIVAAGGPETLEPGDRVHGQATMLGFAVDGVADVTAAGEAGLSHDVVVGIGMRVTYEIEDLGYARVVRHRLEARLPGGPLGAVLGLLLRWRLRSMQRKVLDRLTHPESS